MIDHAMHGVDRRWEQAGNRCVFTLYSVGRERLADGAAIAAAECIAAGVGNRDPFRARPLAASFAEPFPEVAVYNRDICANRNGTACVVEST